MKAIGSVIRAPLKMLGIVQSPGKAPKPLASVTRDEARDKAILADELRRRKGGAADLLTGSGGAEAAAGSTGKTSLG